MRSLNILLLTSFLFSLNADFIRKSPNIILDTKTNFLWQDTKDVSTLKINFTDAVSYCKKLDLDGVKGWKLPNMKKLFSIVDTKKYNPAIDTAFKFIKADTHWTSREFGNGVGNDAYTVNFKTGSFFRRDKADKYNFRCIK